MKSVDIPDFGTVDFPDEMSEEQISTVIKKQIMPQVEADTAARKKADRASRGEDPEGDSPNYVSNIARGIGERALQLGGGLMRMAGTTAEDVGDWLERRIPLGTIGSPGTPMTEEQIQQNTVPLTDWGNAAANTQLGYQERTSWQDVKEHPFANVLPFAVEQGLRSIPDMAAVMFAPGAYVASRTGEIAQTRAENDGRDRATVDDLMRAAPAAAVSALLERYGTHSIAGLGDHAALTAMNQLPKAALKAGVKEGGTEFGQEVTEYLGENLGTQKGATVGEALERGLAGAIAGAPFGGGVRGLTGSVQVWAANRGVEPTVENLQNAAAEGDTQAIDILRAAGLMSDEQLTALSPDAAKRFAERYQGRLAAQEDPILAAQRTQEAIDRRDLEGGDTLPNQRPDRIVDEGGNRREDILKVWNTAMTKVDAAIEAGTVKPEDRDAATRQVAIGLMPELDTRERADARTVAAAQARINQILAVPTDQATPELAQEYLELKEVVERSRPDRVIPLGETRIDDKAATGYTQDAGLRRAVNTAVVLNTPLRIGRGPGMSDAEVAYAQAVARRTQEEAARDIALAGDQKIVLSGERLARTVDQDLEQRQADEAMRLAERQRARAGETVRDTQAGGRPPGGVESQFTVLLDEGRPVEELSRRTVPNSKGEGVSMSTVRRYDPRTGKPDIDPETGESLEYEVPTAKLQASQYATDKDTLSPRRSQQFETEAQTGKVEPYKVEPHRDARGKIVESDAVGQKVTPDAAGRRIDTVQGPQDVPSPGLPRQTYRTTEPDPTVAGAEGPTTELPGQGPVPRSPRPDQGDGRDYDYKSGGRGPNMRGDQTTGEARARDAAARAKAWAEAEKRRRERVWEEGQRGQTQDEKTGEQTGFGKAKDRYAGQTGIFSGKPKGVDEDGWPLTDEDGYILSDKGGPIRFEPTKAGKGAMRKRLIELRRAHPDAMIVHAVHPGTETFRSEKTMGTETYFTLQATQPKPAKVDPEQEQTAETEAAPETPSSAPSVPAVAPDEYPGFTKREIRDGSGREPGRRGATRQAPFTAPESFAPWQARREQDIRDLEEASAAEAPSPYGMRERNVRDASGREPTRRGAERGAPFTALETSRNDTVSTPEQRQSDTETIPARNPEQLVASAEKALRDRQVKPAPKAIARHFEIDEGQAANVLATIAGRSDKVIRQTKDGRFRLTPRSDKQSLINLLASKGGLAPNGDLSAMDLDKLRTPSHGGMLVRKGGMTLDQARELAEEEGFLGVTDDYQTSDIQDLLDALDAEHRGSKVKAERTGFGSDRDQMEARARELGIEVNPDWNDAELMVEIGEAEAIANEDNPTVQAADNLREVVDAMLVELGIFPDSYQADFDIPFGDERAGSDQGAREVGTAAEGDAETAPEGAGREAGTVRPDDRAAETRTGDAQEAGRTGERQTPAIEKTDQGDQYVLINQASGRDGKKTGKGPQKQADEGLFAEDDAGPDPRQIDLEEAIAAAKVDEKPTPEAEPVPSLQDRVLTIADAYEAMGDSRMAALARHQAKTSRLGEWYVADFERKLREDQAASEAEPDVPAKGTQRTVDGTIVIATGDPDKPWAGGKYVEKGAQSGWQPDKAAGFGSTPEEAAAAVMANRRRADIEQKKRAEADNQLLAAVERAKRGETLDAATLKAITRYGDGKVDTTRAKSFLIGMGLNTKQADDAINTVPTLDRSEGGAWLYDLGRIIRAGQNVLDVAKVVENTPAPKAEAALKPVGVAAGVNRARAADIAGNATELEKQIYDLHRDIERRKDRKELLARRAREAKEHWNSGPEDRRKLGGLSNSAMAKDRTARERDENLEEIRKGEAKLKELAAKLPPNPPKRKQRAQLLSRLLGRDQKTELTAEMEAADDAAWRARLEQIAPRAETVADVERILDENVERGILNKGTAKGIKSILGRMPTNGLKGIRLMIQDRMTADEREILGTAKGVSGEVIIFDPDTRVLVVTGENGSADAVETFVHENAHTLFQMISDQDRALARQIYDSLPVSRQALHTLSYDKDTRFEEWFAESAVDHYVGGFKTDGQRSSIPHMLGGLLQRLFKRIVDTFSNEKRQVDVFFAGLGQSLAGNGRASIDEIVRRERRGVSTLAILSNPIGAITGDWKAWRSGYQELANDVAEAWRDRGNRPNRQSAIGGFARMFFYSADGEFRSAIGRFNSPTLNLMADTFHARAGGVQGLDRNLAIKLDMKLSSNATFDEAVTRKVNTDLRQLDRILRDFREDPAAMDRIVDLVQRPSARRSDPESVAASEIARMLAGLHRYMKDAGVDVGEIKNGYFPREIDTGAVLKNPTGFVEQAVKAYRATGMGAKEAKEAADNWLTNILYGGSGSPARKAGGGSPSFVQSRVLTKQADQILKEFYQRDPDAILGSYITRAVKRAEIARRFGDNWANWEKIEQQIRTEDPAAAGMLDHFRSYAATATGSQHHNVPNIVRQGSSVVRTITTLGLLEKSTFSSLAEAITPAIRSGNYKDFFPAITKTLNEIRRELQHMPPSVAAELAADIGAVAGSGVNSIMAARFAGGDPLGRAQAKVLSTYFRRIGLEQWTDATRVASTERGAVFIRRLARDIAGRGLDPSKSRIYMAELGVPENQLAAFVKFVNGFGDNLPSPSDLDKAGEMGTAYRTALLRFVDQTIMRPNATTRPRWASHPLGAIAFQLQAFTYAFSKNVLLRSARLAKTAMTEKDLDLVDRILMLGPLAMLAPLAMVQYIVGELRDWLFMDPERRKAQTQAAKIEKAISRAGLTGALDPYLQMVTGARYQKDPISTFTGPFLGVFSEGISALTQVIANNSPNTNAAERKAAEALYDVLVEPLANMLLGFAPVSLATGGVTSFLLPAMRDDFVDSVAGPRIGHKQQPVYGLSELVMGKQFESHSGSGSWGSSGGSGSWGSGGSSKSSWGR